MIHNKDVRCVRVLSVWKHPRLALAQSQREAWGAPWLPRDGSVAVPHIQRLIPKGRDTEK